MLSTAAHRSLNPIENTMRSRVTPGQLYRMLSADFRAQRPGRCVCRMPMVALRSLPPPGGPNWSLEPSRPCERCGVLVARIAWEYAQRYDLR